VSISGLEAKLREVIDRAIRRVFPKRSVYGVEGTSTLGAV
jgi:hypothetical protein